MTRKDTVMGHMADQVMDLDSPAYGDERERSVFMESSTFGLTIALYLGAAGAFTAALFGYLLLPAALLAMIACPSLAASWYAKRKGVDIQMMAETAGARSTVVNAAIFSGAMVLTCAVVSYTLWTGDSLLAAPSVDPVKNGGFLRGFLLGAAVGGMAGGLAGLFGLIQGLRKAKRSPQ
ncbi:hypothetical protein [Kocuria atrinae]|uniref:DUF4199 domain-containing protein n=1 Tax=Kocuria atrinae TaxID=592377 RepID=A0ABP5JFD8_9MICC|nr:hypothetical protein [Kocuria atrinae]